MTLPANHSLLHIRNRLQLQELFYPPLSIEPALITGQSQFQRYYESIELTQPDFLTPPCGSMASSLNNEVSHNSYVRFTSQDLLHAHAVDVDCSSVDSFRDLETSPKVVGEDGTGKTVVRIISDVNRLLVAINGDQ